MKSSRLISVLLFLLVFMVFPKPLYAHPGRTASDGCHYCRTNCDDWGVPWNVRHCHGGSITPTDPPFTPTPTKLITPSITPKPTSTPRPTYTPTPTSQIVITASPTNPPSPTPEVKGDTTKGGSAANWLVGAGIGSFVLWRLIKWIDSKAPNSKTI